MTRVRVDEKPASFCKIVGRANLFFVERVNYWDLAKVHALLSAILVKILFQTIINTGCQLKSEGKLTY